VSGFFQLLLLSEWNFKNTIEYITKMKKRFKRFKSCQEVLGIPLPTYFA
jgi:hypothetical protein